MLFFLMITTLMQPVYEITETEVYQPLSRSEVIVRPDGHIYVLNFDEVKIMEFDGSGKLVRNIGAKGKGPGEFTYPSDFFFQNNQLYVFDVLSNEISVFDTKGVFQRRIKTGTRGAQLCKTKAGWVYFTQSFMDPDAKIEVFWVDEEFENKKPLITFDNPGFSRGLMVMSDGTHTTAKYSPIAGMPYMVATLDGNQVLLAHGTQSKIFIIDDQQGDIVETIDLKLKKIPFDLDWAEEQLKETKERSKGRLNAKIETNYPDYFPAFRAVISLPGGGIALNRWAGRPDERNYPLFLDMKGNETKSPYNWETLDRLVGTHDGLAFITFWNDEEDFAGIAAVKQTQAEKWVAEHDNKFDGEAGRSISISN